MRFSSREDIEAPIEHVYGKLTDFYGFERSAMRRGVKAEREDPSAPIGIGTIWHVRFKFRGKPRAADVELVKLDENDGFEVSFKSGGIEGLTSLELVPLSPHRTRMILRLDLSAKTLAARLLLQSLKLAKSNLTHRFKTRVADFAEEIETSYTGV